MIKVLSRLAERSIFGLIYKLAINSHMKGDLFFGFTYFSREVARAVTHPE
jgi:hypothetical protein